MGLKPVSKSGYARVRRALAPLPNRPSPARAAASFRWEPPTSEIRYQLTRAGEALLRRFDNGITRKG